MQEVRIGLDAMGGDFAPEATVMGAIGALEKISPASRIVLFGDSAAIRAILEREGCPADRFDIVHTSEVIGMGDHPAQAFAKKTDSSIAVGFGHLAAGKIDGFASAGSTGAMMVGCMYAIKPVEGLIRPTIASTMPTAGGGHTLLLDVGLNVDCKPEVLCQYGVMGSIVASAVLGIERPRVALLNIGEEKEKGNLATKAAHELLAQVPGINFVGNVEAKHVFTGDEADVIVCDGFVGNIVIKQAEGLYSILKAQGVRNYFVEQLNYEKVGGTPVLGINSTVIIGHGCSSAEAIGNMVLQTEKNIRAGYLTKLKKVFTSESV